MLLMADRNDLHSLVCFNRVENPKTIKPEFPRSNGIGSERFLLLRSDFRIRLPVSNDPGDNDPLFMGFEVGNVPLALSVSEIRYAIHRWYRRNRYLSSCWRIAQRPPGDLFGGLLRTTVPKSGNGMTCTALPQAVAERDAEQPESNSLVPLFLNALLTYPEFNMRSGGASAWAFGRKVRIMDRRFPTAPAV